VRPIPAIFSLLVGAVGWYYLFYSQASARLAGIEEQRNNRLRGMLRRTNAIVTLLIAVGIAAGYYRFDQPGYESQFVATWLAVMVLLLIFVALALIDVRLTWKLRRALRERKRS
jgi:membrane protein YdbS with pleckstrin-like domain